MVIYKKITTVNINVSTVVTVIVAGVAEVMEPKLNSPHRIKYQVSEGMKPI